MMQRIVLASAPLLVAVLALVWFVAPDSNTRWQPESVWSPQPGQWEPLSARLRIREHDLLLRADDSQTDLGLVTLPQQVQAEAYRYLRLDADASHGLRPLLIWNAQGGQHRRWLPWGGGSSVIDLSDHPAWSGPIEQLVLLWPALDLARSAAVSERRVVLRDLRLESDNRVAALAMQRSHWFSWQPWSGRSINARGFEIDSKSLQPLLPWLALLLAAVGWAGALLARRPWRRGLLCALLLAWAGLLLLELRQHLWRASVYATLSPSQADEPRLSASPVLQAEIAKLHSILDTLPAGTRILIHADNRFLREYSAFLLRDRDVAALPSADSLPADLQSRNTLLLLIAPGAWNFDAGNGQLQFEGRELPARALQSEGPLQLYLLGPDRLGQGQSNQGQELHA